MMAEQSLKAAQPNYNKPITTLILPAGQFYDAEE
jgi:peptide methionine sulfoxide reductase MsrA